MRKESKNYETSVYKDIIEKLPKEMANNGGAYVTYFAAFAALSNKTSVSTSNLPIPESASLHFLHCEVQDKITKSTSGVFERKCIFCRKARKKVKGDEQPLWHCQMDLCEDCINSLIRKAEDEALGTAVGTVNFFT